jgi:hypothetical protein
MEIAPFPEWDLHGVGKWPGVFSHQTGEGYPRSNLSGNLNGILRRQCAFFLQSIHVLLEFPLIVLGCVKDILKHAVF